jgi:hypothetical protein
VEKSPLLRFVTGKRIVKTAEELQILERTHAFVTVNYNMCKSAIVLPVLSVFRKTCNQSANKSNHPNKNP